MIGTDRQSQTSATGALDAFFVTFEPFCGQENFSREDAQKDTKNTEKLEVSVNALDCYFRALLIAKFDIKIHFWNIIF